MKNQIEDVFFLIDQQADFILYNPFSPFYLGTFGWGMREH